MCKQLQNIISIYLIILISCFCIAPPAAHAQTSKNWALKDSIERKLKKLKPIEQMEFLYQLGNDYYYMHPNSEDFSTSIDIYMQLGELAKKNNNEEYRAKFHKGMGTIYATYKMDKDKTHYHYNEYYKWCRIHCDAYNLICAAFNLVLVNNLNPQTNYSESNEMIKLMTEKLKIVKDHDDANNARVLISMAFSYTSDTQAFINSYNSIDKTTEIKNEEYDFGTYFRNITEYYYSLLGDYKSTIKFLEDKLLENPTDSLDIVNRLAEAYYANGEKEKAADLMQLSGLFQREPWISYAKRNTMLKLKDVEQKEAEERLLQAQEQNNKNTIQIRIISSALLLIAVFLIGLFFQFRKTDLMRKKLQTQDAEKTVLLREIHHRVKNNMQLISSMLGMQQIKFPNLPPEMFQEINSRIKSMATVHNMLYAYGGVNEINMNDYFQLLLKEVTAANSKPMQDVQWQVEAAGITLPYDFAISLGLMLNELAINSLKYADPLKPLYIQILGGKTNEGNMQIQYIENGIDITEIWNDDKKIRGLKLIKQFARQLEAKINYQYFDQNSNYTIIFQP